MSLRFSNKYTEELLNIMVSLLVTLRVSKHSKATGRIASRTTT